jgi:protein-S-isoprenylcysteine O-methyltransferase Ste14
MMELKQRATLRFTLTSLFLAALLFVPAWSLRFSQAWVFLLSTTGFSVFFFLHLLRNDPQLLARRLQSKESDPRQKWLLRIFSFVLYSGFVVAGFDFRLGWSRSWLGSMPLPLEIAGQIGVAAGYWLVFWVMKTNSFAASVIQVEAGQTVIQTGPYALVRHPMYTGMAVIMLTTPLALGSYMALPIFALIVPILVYRLVHEEETLCRDLRGYAEYCDRTPFRLLPGVW